MNLRSRIQSLNDNDLLILHSVLLLKMLTTTNGQQQKVDTISDIISLLGFDVIYRLSLLKPSYYKWQFKCSVSDTYYSGFCLALQVTS